MIEAGNLMKAYDDPRHGSWLAVAGVSFTVYPGEIFGLLGPNGAGKTTLLRMLATMLTPSCGFARIAGWDVVHDPHEVRRHIGFVSHNTSVYERMTPRELITFFGRLHGISSAPLRTRLSSLAETLQMHEFMDTPCSRLSTGMRQKVSIARALVHDPLVLIFDEPTLGLDVIVARNLLETIRDLRHAGKTILFSTHVMREVERICDRVAILSQGQIIDCGTLTELRARHGRHDFEELLYGLLLAHRASPDEVANSGVIPTEGLG